MSSEPQEVDVGADGTEDKPPEWPVTVKLKHPVQFGTEHIGELVFRRGKLGDLKGVGTKAGELPSIDHLMLIASRMCGKQLKVIEMLDADDAEEVTGIAFIFFAKCHPAMTRR